MRSLSGMLVLALIMLFVCSPPTQANDSLSMAVLLKKGAKAEKERAKEAKKQPTASVITYRNAGAFEHIECVWIAKVGNEYRYLQKDGKLVRTPITAPSNVEGPILTVAPAIELIVHRKHCNGKTCEPTETKISVPAWPE